MFIVLNIILFATIIAVLVYSYLNINKLQTANRSIKNQITGLQKDVKGTIDSIDTINKNSDIATKETRDMLMNSTTNLQSNIDKVSSDDKDLIQSTASSLQSDIEKTSTNNKNLLQSTASSLQSNIASSDLRKGGSISGDINISGKTKTSVLKLGDKFSLSGVGDVHGNDQWLRLLNKDATGYADGGFAAKRIWTNEGIIDGSQHVSGDLVFNGDNKWIVHTPDDGRKTMYIAPAGKNGDWDWDKQMNINNDGSVYMKYATVGTDMSVNGNLTMGPAKAISSSGRMHISGNELLYLLNKDGVIVGKEWGGNGNLSVQGKTTTNELNANKICIGSTCINENQLKKIAT